MIKRSQALSRQRGVAVVTALLLTTLAITIVASLFWQQQVQVRSIENQRLQLQKEWILRGALDWARLILREDARVTATDNLDEPWAVPLEDTKLDQYVENGPSASEASDASLSGNIIDAESRYNLTNLCINGEINQEEVAAFGRLLSTEGLNPSLALATATLKSTAQKSLMSGGDSQPMDIQQVDDLLAVPGFSEEMLNKIKDFVVVLPEVTPINVNTAPAEVLAAKIDSLSLSDAQGLVASRQRAFFLSTADFVNRIPGKKADINANNIDIKTNYFGRGRFADAVAGEAKWHYYDSCLDSTILILITS
jgi:general secretion pathway protein K